MPPTEIQKWLIYDVTEGVVLDLEFNSFTEAKTWIMKELK
jgi:hypothetical protein